MVLHLQQKPYILIILNNQGKGGFVISLDVKDKHLLLFDYGLFDRICDKIKYLISKKSCVTSSVNYNFGKIKINSFNSSSIKKY